MSPKRTPPPPPQGPDPRGSVHVATRLTVVQVNRLDALIPRLSTPWLRATRSDVIRAVVDAGLSAVEGTAPKGGRP